MSLFDKRFVINTGKGGVGKTAVSAAMAVAFAQQGKRVLLMELNARDKLADLFGAPIVDEEIREIAPHICAVNTNARAALREYVLMILRMKVMYRVVFENRLVSTLLRAIPGLPELTMLGKAYYHAEERDAGGRHVWDAVILDAPATGHGMFLLQIPQVIAGAVVGSGLMTRESKQMVELLADRRRTAINLVTLTEEMPVNETIEYRRRLRDQLDVEVGWIIANGVFPRTFSAEDAERVNKLLDAHRRRDDDLGSLLDAARFRAERCALQVTYLERLRRDLRLPVVEVPYYFDAKFDRKVLDKMAARIATGVAEEARR